ncbi:hypothetical protein RchiOBHm_Chr1g0328561 [Rosa chinensis]|uniref:Uncharacterized protein n=1 Tax=Rosa chinensis TaxID=74649 RepID=A0A2P6SAV4_ROSCH|nr:hypothetical protein RchiOBHm_Chr1g0328541 [Rosa chinensis]PRQ55797.1 hypothetical protein RchiOBHm_Chr1g0328561 [Rosa chinensis]
MVGGGWFGEREKGDGCGAVRGRLCLMGFFFQLAATVVLFLSLQRERGIYIWPRLINLCVCGCQQREKKNARGSLKERKEMCSATCQNLIGF